MTEKNIKEDQKLYAIKEGTVIDHIPARQALNVISVLGINEDDSIIGMGINFKSQKTGHKDIVKIENKHITKDELDKIALFAPRATINRINNYKVAEKLHVDVPEVFVGIVRCANPNCITRNQQSTTKFYTRRKDPLLLQCHYCEKLLQGKQIRLL